MPSSARYDLDQHAPAADPAPEAKQPAQPPLNRKARKALLYKKKKKQGLKRRRAEKRIIDEALKASEDADADSAAGQPVITEEMLIKAMRANNQDRKAEYMKKKFAPQIVTDSLVTRDKYPFHVLRPRTGPHPKSQPRSWVFGMNWHSSDKIPGIVEAWNAVLRQAARRAWYSPHDVVHSGIWAAAGRRRVVLALPVFHCGIDPASTTSTTGLALARDTHLCADVLRRLDKYLRRTPSRMLKQYERRTFQALRYSTKRIAESVSKDRSLELCRLGRLGTTATLGAAAGNGDVPPCYSVLCVFANDGMWNASHGQGNLVFPDQNIEVEVRPGDVVFFQGGARHFVRPVDDCDRHRYRAITITTVKDPETPLYTIGGQAALDEVESVLDGQL